MVRWKKAGPGDCRQGWKSCWKTSVSMRKITRAKLLWSTLLMWNNNYLQSREILTSANMFFRSEEHTSELQSLMRISYDVFCLKKKNKHRTCNKNKIPIQNTCHTNT